MKINIYQAKWLGILAYFIFSFIVSSSSLRGFIFFTGVLLMILVLKRRIPRKLTEAAPVMYMFAFLLFCGASVLWAEEPGLVVHKTNMLAAGVFAAFVIYICNLNDDAGASIDNYLKIIMYGGYIVALYCVFKSGWSSYINIIKSGTRLSADSSGTLDRNRLGMLVAYAFVIHVHFILQRRKIRLQDLLLFFAVFVILASGCRKAVLAIAMGLVGIFCLKNYNRADIGNSILRIMIAAFVLLMVFYLCLSSAFFSGIADRFQQLITALKGGGKRGATDGWLRMAYIRLGLQLFERHPVLGIGIGNANLYTLKYYGYDHYLHNNYVELLATAGLAGTLIYYSIYIYLIWFLIKNRKYRDTQYDICFLFLMIRLVMDYGAVCYYYKETYVYLLLFWQLVKKINQRKVSRMFKAGTGKQT